MNIYNSPKRKQSTFRSNAGQFKSSATKKSSTMLHKSNTQITVSALSKQLSIGGPNNKLKQ